MKRIQLIGALFGFLLACKPGGDSDRREIEVNSTKSGPNNQNAQPNRQPDANLRREANTKSYCNGDEKLWVPRKKECQEKLANWGCCVNEVRLRFSDQPKKVNADLNKILAQGFVLYNCSKKKVDHTELHFLKFQGHNLMYKKMRLNGYEVINQVNLNCPKVPPIAFPGIGNF